jgi:hypothetical protein
MHQSQTSNLRRIRQLQTAATVRSRALLRLGILEEKDLPDFNTLCALPEQLTGAELDSLLEVAIGAVSRARRRSDAFAAEFTRCLVERWIFACVRSGSATTMLRAMLKGLARIGLGPGWRSLLDSYRIRRGGIFSLLRDRLAG